MTHCATLIGSLLPATWPARRDLLDAAGRIDVRHRDAGADVLLSHFAEHRREAAPPIDADLRVLVLALAEACGGAPSEPRLTPRPQEAVA